MKNNKAQIMAIYLPLITLFMMGIVVMMYFIQDDIIDNSMAAPFDLLDLKKDNIVFEMQEKDMLIESMKEAAKTNKWRERGFRQETRQRFLNRLKSRLKSKDDLELFIFNNLFFQSKEREFKSIEEREKFIETYVYPESGFYFDDNIFVIKRQELGKRFKIIPEEMSDASFPYTVVYKYDKTYRFDKDVLN